MAALVWFRRDLRVHDHPALCAALARDEQIVPVFCLDGRLLPGRHASGPRTAFPLDCLTDLDAQLAAARGLPDRRRLPGADRAAQDGAAGRTGPVPGRGGYRLMISM
jgi:DNA photolyase